MIRNKTLIRFPKLLKWFDPCLRNVGIEITNRCNLNCEKCFASGRSPKDMSFNLFKKIIDQLNPDSSLGLNYAGESLLNPDFLEMVLYANSKFPKKQIGFTTNGTLLTAYNIPILLDHLGFIMVSLDGYGKINDKLRAGSDFFKVSKSIKKLVDSKKDTKIIVNYTYGSQSRGDFTKFLDHFLKLGVDIVRYKPCFDSDLRLLHDINTGNKFCLYPFEYMSILNNGVCVPCCNDFLGKRKMGTIHKNKIYDVWRSENYFSFRESIIKNKSCFGCTAYKTRFVTKEFRGDL